MILGDIKLKVIIGKHSTTSVTGSPPFILSLPGGLFPKLLLLERVGKPSCFLMNGMISWVHLAPVSENVIPTKK